MDVLSNLWIVQRVKLWCSAGKYGPMYLLLAILLLCCVWQRHVLQCYLAT